MNNKYIDGMNEIKADEELKRKIISNVKQDSSRQASRFFTFKKAAAAVAIAFAFIMVVSVGIPIVQNYSHMEKQGQSKVHSLFNGFVITAYAEGGAPVEVKPDVEFTLGKYQLTMSSVPGFPVKIVCDEADTIKLTATDGDLLLWAPPEYKILNKGKVLEIKSGDTVYWSPMSEASSNVAATNCTLVIEAYKDNEKLGSNTIKLSSDDGYTYTGILSE